MIEMSDAEVEAAIRHIMAQKKTVDKEFARVFFDGKPPEYWGDWPEWARLLWDQWASVFKEIVRAEGGARGAVQPHRKRKHDVSLQEAWDAVMASGKEDPGQRYTWRDLGEKLGIGTRAAEYQLKQKYGFKIEGRPGERELLRAPCIDCGNDFAWSTLKRQRCRPCRTERERWVA